MKIFVKLLPGGSFKIFILFQDSRFFSNGSRVFWRNLPDLKKLKMFLQRCILWFLNLASQHCKYEVRTNLLRWHWKDHQLKKGLLHRWRLSVLIWKDKRYIWKPTTSIFDFKSIRRHCYTILAGLAQQLYLRTILYRSIVVFVTCEKLKQ